MPGDANTSELLDKLQGNSASAAKKAAQVKKQQAQAEALKKSFDVDGIVLEQDNGIKEQPEWVLKNTQRGLIEVKPNPNYVFLPEGLYTLKKSDGNCKITLYSDPNHNVIHCKLDPSSPGSTVLLLQSLEKMKVDPTNMNFSNLDFKDKPTVRDEIKSYIGDMPADSELRVAYETLLADDSKWPSAEEVTAAEVALSSPQPN